MTGPCLSIWIASLALWLCCVSTSTPTAAFVKLPPTYPSRPSSNVALNSLITCLESLSDERKQTEQLYRLLSWLDLSQTDQEKSDDIHSQTTTMPLYPLGAVHLPTKSMVNHTLNNVEPQNIRMVEDLLNQLANYDQISNIENQLKFCVVLRAMDTGRIASIGTVMSIVDAEKQFHYGTNDTARIRLNCHGEQLVEICHIENGEQWGTKRLMKSQDYLRAKVKPIHFMNASTTTERREDFTEKLLSLSKDLRTIKTMYQLDLGSQKDFPPRTLPKLGDAIQDIAIKLDQDEMDSDAILIELERIFWRFAQEWQSICYTLRQGQEALLSAERNELMVEAACAKGGPLNLPIHIEDLEPQDRRQIQLLELQAQKRHIELGIDPVLDFQVLISLPDLEQRISWLGRMVTRERQRLSEFASLRVKRIS
jgi:hypothetical protein